MPDHRFTVQNAHMLRQLAANLAADGALDDALANIERADSLGPTVDPTLYQARQVAMHQDREVLRAVRDLARLGAEADRA